METIGRCLTPNDNAAFKVVYLAMLQASKKWTMPLKDWKAALNRFSIELADRVPPLSEFTQTAFTQNYLQALINI